MGAHLPWEVGRMKQSLHLSPGVLGGGDRPPWQPKIPLGQTKVLEKPKLYS